MPFVKGQSGNPRGRPKGARSKKTLERLAGIDQIKTKLQDADQATDETNFQTPVALLLAFANNEHVNHSLRISAAASVAPYLHPRYGSREVPRVIDTPLDFPEPRSIQQAVCTIAKVSALAASGKIALKDATELVSINKCTAARF